MARAKRVAEAVRSAVEARPWALGALAAAAVVAMAGVFACKAVGLAGPAILIGALAGVAAAMAFSKVSERAGAGRRGEQP